jgi:hypothetical protein
LLTLSFYLARKRQWFLACFSTMLLTISRPVGFLMAIPLISEYIKQNKLSKKSLFFMVYSLLFVSLGLMIYSYFCYLKWNDPLYFFHSQALLQNSRTVSGFVFPLQTIYRYLKILITVSPKIYEWWIALLEFLSFWLACYLLTVGWLKKIRPSYLIFSLMCFFVPVFSGTFSGLPRYIIVIFPLFLALSQSVKNKTVKIFYITAGFITQIVLLAFFSRGYFIA